MNTPPKSVPSLSPTPAVPVRLPVLHWGRPDASRHALLLHGLTSSGACWWRVADELAEAGWSVTAPDLRGHGHAPRTRRYDIASFVADVTPLTPHGGGAWDLVIGHSLGGAIATATAGAEPGWAARLLLVDPALTIAGELNEAMLQAMTAELAATPEALRAAHPAWHPEDITLKAAAAALTSPHVVNSILRQNIPWSYEQTLTAYPHPATVLAADPTQHPAFTAEEGRRVASAKKNFTWSVVEGAGHSIHRDNPAAVIAAALAEPQA
ncbi:alpha/beta fold hydrolase [Streptomyces paludis]|uniref:Alpha/beta fold hydrolase n=1 Tax=Streptomyces paludis TaxID=2282738 RepID=A0A345HP41_9ACTN|nr:alpha/beta hydrolase [Streptomyces paludis]AXG78465.1 alpha/beta fold hydrolase [Streptomyces paludis]